MKAQFIKGYIIDNNGFEEVGLIDKSDLVINHISKVHFKQNESDEARILNASDISEFGVKGRFKIRSKNVDEKDLEFLKISENTSKLFFKTLIEGNPSLYQVSVEGKEYLFIEKDDDFSLLIYSEEIVKGRIQKNREFVTQLWSSRECSNKTISEIGQMDYEIDQIYEFIQEVNKCKFEQITSYKFDESDFKVRRLNLSPFVGVGIASATFDRLVVFVPDESLISDPYIQFGVDIEYFIDKRGRSTSLITSPHFLRVTNIEEVSGRIGNNMTSSHNQEIGLDYKESLILPLGFRYYISNSEKLGIHIEGMFVVNSSLNGNVQVSSSQAINYEREGSFVWGLGLHLNNGPSVNLRLRQVAEFTRSSDTIKASEQLFSLNVAYRFKT